ncbi:hypothetical protein JS44_00655 [Anoxybacillus flavithermus]|uniref:Uncharacterized protein n=1 Tax=Anoxybacillus flavithermus TaxID=33934 RepID=A0A094LCD0_9BACL|nr:hypothetical protein JS44_00655 [Anoxybacillus flavithermus]
MWQKRFKKTGKTGSTSCATKGTALVWNEHHEQDVIGYRVYYAASETATFQVIATIRKGEQKTYR